LFVLLVFFVLTCSHGGTMEWNKKDFFFHKRVQSFFLKRDFRLSFLSFSQTRSKRWFAFGNARVNCH
jgi:hypothetical protein